MNKMKLFEAIDLIDDDLIREAEIPSEKLSDSSTHEQENAVTVSGVEVRGGIRWQRIAALASTFILIAGFGAVGALLYKNRPPRQIEPSEIIIPAATESTTETADKQSESTEAATTETKKTSKAEKKETKESTNTVTTNKADNKPERVDCYAEDKAEKTTSEYMDNNKTQNETPTSTDEIIFESDLFRKLNALNYHAISCDGLPTHKLTAPDGTVYLINLDGAWVWRRPSLIADADNEAQLPQDIIDWLIANQDKVNLQKTQWYQEPTTEPWVIHLPCTKMSNVTWRSYQCPEMFDILRNIQYTPGDERGMCNTYLIDDDDNHRVYALNFDDKWVMKFGQDGIDWGYAPMPDRLYELFCGS